MLPTTPMFFNGLQTQLPLKLEKSHFLAGGLFKLLSEVLIISMHTIDIWSVNVYKYVAQYIDIYIYICLYICTQVEVF